jgi:ABC-type hemin transport system ATPase subunit
MRIPLCVAVQGHDGASVVIQKIRRVPMQRATRSPRKPKGTDRPQVLLADEPVASLDPEAADDIMRLLRHLATDGRLAVLCVLDQVELAYAYADRVVGIRDGGSVFDRPCAELSRDAVRQLYLSEAA